MRIVSSDSFTVWKPQWCVLNSFGSNTVFRLYGLCVDESTRLTLNRGPRCQPRSAPSSFCCAVTSVSAVLRTATTLCNLLWSPTPELFPVASLCARKWVPGRHGVPWRPLSHSSFICKFALQYRFPLLGGRASDVHGPLKRSVTSGILSRGVRPVRVNRPDCHGVPWESRLRQVAIF